MKFKKLNNPFNDSKKKRKNTEQQSTTYDNESNEIERFKAIEIENESLKNEIKSLKDEMEIKDRSFNDYKNELLTFKEGFENVKRTVNKLQNDKQDDEKKYIELKQKYDDQNNKFEELNKKYADQNDNFEELKQKYNNQNNNFEEFKQKYDDQNNNFGDLKQKYNDQSDNLEDLKQKYKVQKDDFEELKRKRDEQIVTLEILNQKHKDQNLAFEELNQKYKDQNVEFEELKRKYNDQNDSFEKFKQKYDDFEELNQKHKDQNLAFEELNQKYKDQNNKFEELKRKYDDQNDSFEKFKQKYKEQIGDHEDLKKQKEYFESQYKKSEQQLKEKTSQIKSLKQKNKELEEEASKYQSALGIATSFDFNIDDQNNNVKLNQDILSLQDTLEIYVTNLKPKIDVNINEVNELLLTYGCQSKISEKDPNKPLIKAVLQRRVLEEILTQAYFYFKEFNDSNKDHHLESNIVSQTVVLNNLMEKLYNSRPGDDEITRITPIRIRQQVYTALATRGFNDIRKTDGEILKHDSIDFISNKINKVINKYRIINDIDKRRYVNALAKDLVLNVVRIFYFRLPIQEPMAQYRWFNNNERINKSYMKGCWDEDEIEDMVVEVCSFPMIYNPEDDGDKICTPAKVFPIHIIKEQSIGEKLMSMVGKYIYSSNDDSNATKFDESDEYDSDQTNVTEPDESSYFHDKINDQVIVY